MVRFESTLYFGNVERFRNMLIAITGQDPSIQQKKRKEVKIDTEGEDPLLKLIENEVVEDYRHNGELVHNGVSSNLT